MWTLESSTIEVVLRASSIYIGLFILFKIIGKKQMGEMSPFDLVLILIISESVSNALGGNEHSILGALLSAATLIAINYAMAYFSFRFRKFEKWTDGEVKILIRDGVVDQKVCRKELITQCEIEEALRMINIEKISDVRIGFLENNGKITAFCK